MHLKPRPPITPEDIEVAYWIGKPPPEHLPSQLQPAGNSTDFAASETAKAAPSSPPTIQASTRADLVKLSSRRTKERVLDDRSKLILMPWRTIYSEG